MMKIATKIFILILAFFTLEFPAYSQETTIVPDSVWETPLKVISYGKEQATMGNHKIIEVIENDTRFQSFSIEAKVNFYDQTQLGFCKKEDWDNAIKYELKSIQLAKDNNREDLNFNSVKAPFVYHNYYWVSCYEVYKENLDSAAYYCLRHLSEVEKYFGIDSKEFLCAILSPTLFSKSRKFVEGLDFGNPKEEYNDSLKPKLIKGHFDSYHDAMLTLNNALSEYQYSDSLLLGDIMWHKGDLLFGNGNIEEGLSLMYQSIALLSKYGLCLTDKAKGGLNKILYISSKLINQDPLTSFLVNKFLLDLASDKFDEETKTAIKSNIVSTAIRLWLFDYADKYLTELEGCGGDDYRITQNKYYRGLYYYEMAKKTQSIEPLYKAIPYYEEIIENSWHKDRMTTHEQLMEIYNVIGTNTGDFSKLEILQDRMLDLEENKILDRLCSSTTNQQYNPLTGMNYYYSVVNTKTIEQLFEHMLFRWSIVSEFSSAIEKLALKDKSLTHKWMTLKELKNKNCSQGRIDSLEYDLMRNINQKKLKKYLSTDISKIKRQLDNEEMLILLIKDDYDSLYAFCLPKTLPPQRILVSDIKTKDLLEQPFSEIADEISRHLSPHLKGYKNIYMLITGSLYMVPLEKSMVSNNKNKNVHRILSFRDIKSKEGGIKNVIAFGNPELNQTGEVSKDRGYFYSPLPGTAIEVDSISKIMNRKTVGMHIKTFVKEEASEENFKLQENSVVNLIHFATHGFLGKQRIFDDSGLLLSGANIELNSDSLTQRFSNEGILRACEIENLHFNNLELVVLSACETGAGGSDFDYGVLGLPLAFHKAGAKKMIVSLKKVDDDTTQAFMINFYKNLTIGKSIYNSFWEAMDKADEDTRNSFILIE
mgnify:FL=1